MPKAARASDEARPARNSTPSRGEAVSRAARIRPSSRFRRSSVAASRLWLSARWASSSLPGTRSESTGRLRRPGRRPMRSPAAGHQVRREEVAEQDPEQGGDDDREEEQPADRSDRSDVVADEQDDQPEAGQRQDGRRDQADREARAERQRIERRPSITFVVAVAGIVDRPAESGDHGRSARRRRPGGLGWRLRVPAAAVSHRPVVPPRRAGSRRRGRSGSMDRAVRVELDLLAQPAHRDPDVGRIGILGLGPAALEQGLGRHRLADVGRQRVQQARLGRGERDRFAPTVAWRLWRSSVRSGPRRRLWRGTLSPSRRLGPC